MRSGISQQKVSTFQSLILDNKLLDTTLLKLVDKFDKQINLGGYKELNKETQKFKIDI